MASTSIADPHSQIEITNAFDGIAPPSAFASISATSFDVFINHHGSDVKHRLARALYHALHATGLRVFLDSEELQLGDFFPRALEAAMTSSSLHIAIFSPNYAKSPWCLAELSFMLKTDATIIPVFYHVEPNDLRWVVQGKGEYAQAFLEHQQKGRYSLEKLEEWKMALHNVSFNKGEIIKNDDEEQMTLKTIVNHVLKVMQIVPLQVAKHPVGLEEAVVDFEIIAYGSVKSQSNVQIVGIWGMGGSGKTTLAKELYNQKRMSVEKSSFLFDVRDAAAKSELYKKQIKLAQDLGFKGENFDNIEQGKGILLNCLRSDRVLIILDDVDHIDQLDALLPTKDSLGSGSLIIVTTREKEVLRCWGISSIYSMKAMNVSHAKQLFCWHAFLQPYPQLEFGEFVEKFLHACNGLPLSLKVLGSQLYGCSDKDLWRDLLDKISKILPRDIMNCLKVSYDALDVQEKQIFLDIACLFIGKNNKSAIAVWEGSGWKGMYGWKRLVNKCLVELDDYNCIKMHDHLRDLGREIANTQSPYRLWSRLPDQIKVIQKREGERFQIRGMILNRETDDGHEFPGFRVNTSSGFSSFWSWSRRPPFRLAKEVFFVGENILDKGICNLSGELAWLSCAGMLHTHLPSWLPLKNLRVLELADCGSKLKELWKDSAQAPVQLRELVIHKCGRFQRFPKSIGLLQHLRKIVLSESNKVGSLPEEFCLLQSLEHLRLDRCEILSLPSSFGDLTNLQHLELRKCFKLRVLPISFKQLRLLDHLHIERCPNLTLQSDILEYMTKLEYLSLLRLRKLKELPRHLINQASLRELYLEHTSIRELPENIGQLTKLRVMKIKSCKIECLPESMGLLNLLDHLELEDLPVECLPESMGCLRLLSDLVLSNLEVEWLPQSCRELVNLHFLSIYNCPISEFLFGPSEFPVGWESSSSPLCMLEKISISWTTVSKILISEECCPGLLTLTLNDNEHLREIHTLPTTLKFINVERCGRLSNMSGIAGLSNLKMLIIQTCPQLDALPSFAELASLEGFTVTGCDRIQKIEGLQHCRSLETLLISGCPELHSLPSFADLVFLKAFELRGRNKVEKIKGLQHSKSLEKLVVEYACWELASLESSLEHLQGLKIVQLVANRRSAIEPCIKTIQKWPANIVICTKAAPGAGSLLNPQAFPNLSVVHSFGKSNSKYTEVGNLPIASPFMLCLVINCSSPRMSLRVVANYYEESLIWLDEGKAMVIGVFAQHSIFVQHPRFLNFLYFHIKPAVQSDRVHIEDNEVEKGFLLSGEENSIVEAFHRLFALLGN